MEELNQVGIGERADLVLSRLVEDGYFNMQIEAYQFCVAFALAHGKFPSELSDTRKNKFSVSTLDPSKDLYAAIKALAPEGETTPYRWAERLADWGATEIGGLLKEDKFKLAAILKEFESPSNL